MKFIQENKNSIEFIKNIFSNNKKIILTYLTFVVCSSLIGVIVPLVAKYEIDQLANKYDNFIGIFHGTAFEVFIFILGIILIINFIESIIDAYIKWFESNSLEVLKGKARLLITQRLENIEIGFYVNERNHKIIDELSHFGYEFVSEIKYFIGNFLHNIISFLGIIIVFSYINIRIALILMITVLTSYFINRFSEKVGKKYELQKRYDNDHNYSIYMRQLSNRFNLVYVTGGFKYFIDRINYLIGKNMDLINQNQKNNFIIAIMRFLNSSIGDTFIKIIVGYSILRGFESVGIMTMTLMYTGRISGFFNFLITLKDDLNTKHDTLKSIEIYLNVTNPDTNRTESLSCVDKIEISNLNFRYPNISEHELKLYEIYLNRFKSYGGDSERIKNNIHLISSAFEEVKTQNSLVLKNINLTFEKGKIYGLVGKNGAGKTTLTSLLLNYFSKYEGDILFNGIQINKLKSEVFFKNIGIITQDPYILYGFTIRENIMLGVEKEYEDDYIYSLLADFGLDKKIKGLRKGLDSELGYSTNFSGGQEQLLVLIRLILQDKNVLILDEGTNQLDAENEMIVMEKLLKNRKDKIVIFITHRMTTIRRADMIYCMENGEVTSIGLHDELVGKENIYSKFWYNQVESNFILDK